MKTAAIAYASARTLFLQAAHPYKLTWARLFYMFGDGQPATSLFAMLKAAVAASAVRDPSNEVFLSAVSSWEIVVKHGMGRLPLPEPPDRLIPTERRLRGIAALAFMTLLTAFGVLLGRYQRGWDFAIGGACFPDDGRNLRQPKSLRRAEPAGRDECRALPSAAADRPE